MFLFPLFQFPPPLSRSLAAAVENDDDDDAFRSYSRSLLPCLLLAPFPFFDPAATLEPLNGTSLTARRGLWTQRRGEPRPAEPGPAALHWRWWWGVGVGRERKKKSRCFLGTMPSASSSQN